MFVLRVEDAETGGGDWDEVLRNPRINRACVSHTEILPPHSGVVCLGKLPPSHLEYIISQMVARNLAVYEPSKQTRSVLLYWRLPEEWAEVLHQWVRTSDQAPRFGIYLALSMLTACAGIFDWSA